MEGFRKQEIELSNGKILYIYKNLNEGKIKSTEQLILIDEITGYEHIKCPVEVQQQLLFIGFKGLTDYVFNQ
tara:strand:+ start:473 stop:688 length:216 start_codon:yes stop_codon:yes gene_type:complete